MILAFATADPKVEVFADQGVVVPRSARLVASVAFVRPPQRRGARRWCRAGRSRPTPAWGSILVSFFVGAALIAAVIDIPLFARTTIYRDSQLMAALVLVRFLVALPVGAVVGGFLTRRFGAGRRDRGRHGVVAAARFVWMTTWEHGLPRPLRRQHPAGALRLRLRTRPRRRSTPRSWPAPTTTCTGWPARSWSSAGWSACWSGISALTAIGLRRYYAAPEENPLPPAREVCDGETRCKAFTDLLAAAGHPPGARRVRRCGCLRRGRRHRWPLVVFRGAVTRGVSPADLLRSAG